MINNIDMLDMKTKFFLDYCSDSELLKVNMLLNSDMCEEAFKIIDDFNDKYFTKEKMESSSDNEPLIRGPLVRELSSQDITEEKDEKELKRRKELEEFMKLIESIKLREKETKEYSELNKRNR